MIEMVERIAKAFAGYEGWNWDSLDELEDTSFGWGRNHIRQHAYQMLRTIREPTERMYMRGGNANVTNRGPYSKYKRIGDMAAASAWRDMCDASLEDPFRS